MSRFDWGSFPLFAIDDESATLVAGVEGHRIWITDVVVECGIDTTMQLTDSDDDEIFPAVNSVSISNLAAPIRVGSGKGVKCVKSGLNDAKVWIGYYLEPESHV